jgi:hypothetical protein
LTTNTLGVLLIYKHKIERGNMGRVNNSNLLQRVLTKELGDEAGSMFEDNICVGIVRPLKRQLFEELGGYTFVELPESSLCGHGLTAVLRPKTQHETFANMDDSAA